MHFHRARRDKAHLEIGRDRLGVVTPDDHRDLGRALLCELGEELLAKSGTQPAAACLSNQCRSK